MPLYEFECTSCHETFEELLLKPAKGDEADGVECPHCGGHDVRKRQSGFATFSGGGSRSSGGGGGCSPGGRFR
jgi:putative FmdB family regulatory protein